MKIGILTGGGDCPGLNAVIRAAVRKGTFHYDDTFVGFLEGWRGLVEDKSMPLDLQAVAVEPVITLERLDEQVVHREPDRPAPV